MEGLELKYEMGGSGNYLAASVSEEINTYQLKMIEYNKIPGILPISARMLNGEYKLQYDITGKSRLIDVLKKGDCTGEPARKILYSIAYALVHAEEYLLTYKQFLLEKEYIFMDDAGKVAFVYLPFSNKTITTPNNVQDFLKNLLLEHFTADGNAYFLNLLRYVSMSEYSLSGILEKLEQGEAGASAKSQEREPQQNASVLKQERIIEKPAPSPIPEVKQEKAQGGFSFDFQPKVKKNSEPEVKAEQKEKKAEQPVFGFAVPGMDNFPVAGKKEEKVKEKVKEKKEKEKKSSLFGSFKSKEKKEEVVVGHEVFAEKPVSRNESREGDWTGTQIGLGAPVKQGTISMADDLDSVSVGIKIDGIKVEFRHFPFNIGRVEGDYLIERARVSGKHLYFTENDGHYFVTDDNSRNHTYVNGRVIAPYTPVEVSSGDSIRLADVEVTFYVDK